MTDVAIIGGGISGCSLLYALSRYTLRTVLLEAENDVGVGSTKANSAIVHAGYDPAPGTLMAKYNVEGASIIRRLAEDLDILYRACGSLTLGFNSTDAAHLRQLYGRGIKNGVSRMELIDAERLRAIEPGVSRDAVCALYAPGAAVVNPWELAFAQAEAAVQNGAEVMLDAKVTSIEKRGGFFALLTAKGMLEARFVVNCAGINAQRVAEMAGPAHFSINTSRGEYFLLDKSECDTVRHVIFQCPTKAGKGILVAPTVHGNLIVGPNAEDAGDTSTTASGLAEVRRQALRSVPGINFAASIRNFAGLRAQANTGDFVIGESPGVPRFFNVAGIKSPGLTAAPAIAQAMVQLLANSGLNLKERANFDPVRRVKRFRHMDIARRKAAIAENPLYAGIVCRCETVTEGEIVDALRRPLPPRSLDAVKRRVSAGFGRCQGGFCGPRVQAIIARELKIPQSAVPQDRAGMNIITGRTKGEACIEVPGGDADD